MSDPSDRAVALLGALLPVLEELVTLADEGEEDFTDGANELADGLDAVLQTKAVHSARDVEIFNRVADAIDQDKFREAMDAIRELTLSLHPPRQRRAVTRAPAPSVVRAGPARVATQLPRDLQGLVGGMLSTRDLARLATVAPQSTGVLLAKRASEKRLACAAVTDQGKLCALGPWSPPTGDCDEEARSGYCGVSWPAWLSETLEAVQQWLLAPQPTLDLMIVTPLTAADRALLDEETADEALLAEKMADEARLAGDDKKSLMRLQSLGRLKKAERELKLGVREEPVNRRWAVRVVFWKLTTMPDGGVQRVFLPESQESLERSDWMSALLKRIKSAFERPAVTTDYVDLELVVVPAPEMARSLLRVAQSTGLYSLRLSKGQLVERADGEEYLTHVPFALGNPFGWDAYCVYGPFDSPSKTSFRVGSKGRIENSEALSEAARHKPFEDPRAPRSESIFSLLAGKPVFDVSGYDERRTEFTQSWRLYAEGS